MVAFYRWVVLVCLSCALATGAAAQVEIPVTTEMDSGDFSLRTALLKASVAPEEVTITFSDDVRLIRPLSQLPGVGNPDHPVTLQGNGNVRIDGTLIGGPSHGLAVTSSNVTIHGLTLTGFVLSGIFVSAGDNTSITGCLIGTDGNLQLPNGDGIAVTTTGSVRIGGAQPSTRNVISGNSNYGIRVLSGSGPVTVQGNYIGLTPDGLLPLGNGTGIFINGGSSHLIGGDAPGEGNVISGNQTTIFGSALQFLNGGQDSVVQGNIIGLDATGLAAVPNLANGILIEQTDNLRIGGTTPGARNIITGNVGIALAVASSDNILIEGNYFGVDANGGGNLIGGPGILLEGNSTAQIGGAATNAGNVIANAVPFGINVQGTSEAIIQGNTIGMDASRTVPLGCALSGVRLAGGPSTVGGLSAAAGNLIAHNGAAGVEFTRGLQVLIRRNLIFANDFTGILSAGDGADPVPPPTLSGSFPISGTTTPGATVELFVDDQDQGRIYVGSAVANGFGAFSSAVSLAAFEGKNLTATTTIPFGFTSTFSQPLAIALPNDAHVADTDRDLTLSLSELLRIIQFYNAGSIACASPPGSTEDGYATEGVNRDCAPHSLDFAPQDWSINLSELLRAIQVFSLGGYQPCNEGTPDEGGFCTIPMI